jgi:hypothetical protein
MLDARLTNFPAIPDTPHMPKTIFKGGLTRIIKDTNKQVATGAGGGFRSSHWITAIFQLIFVIGTDGEILPNTKSFYGKNDENLGNVQAKVLDCCYAILICYFECKRSSFTDSQVETLDRYCQAMHVSFSEVLWDLYQAAQGIPKGDRFVSSLNVNHLHLA